MPNGPSRKLPPWRSSRLPNTLGESKLGTHSQSIAPSGATSAPVWQSDRNAYSSIGGNSEGAAALCGGAAVLSAVGSAGFCGAGGGVALGGGHRRILRSGGRAPPHPAGVIRRHPRVRERDSVAAEALGDRLEH